MRSITLRLVFATFVVCAIWTWSAHGVAAQRTIPIVTRIFTGPDGQTRAETIDVKLTPVASRYAQWWEESETTKVTDSQFVRLAPGFVQDWHTASARRYVITLSGSGEVELSGGQKIQLNPGRILLAEDMTGKGHITRTLGKADWIALFVEFADH